MYIINQEIVNNMRDLLEKLVHFCIHTLHKIKIAPKEYFNKEDIFSSRIFLESSNVVIPDFTIYFSKSINLQNMKIISTF